MLKWWRRRRVHQRTMENIKRIMTSHPGWCESKDRQRLLAYFWVKDGVVRPEDVAKWR